MKRRPPPEAEVTRQGLMAALREIAEAGGVVLVGATGQPFAFYPPRAVPDPGAPGRLRELVGRRVEEGA